MDLRTQSTIDRLMLSDVSVRVIHALAIAVFSVIFSLEASTNQTIVVIVVGLLLIFQSMAPLFTKNTMFSNAWPTILLHLVAAAIISLWFLAPGSPFELVWMIVVVAAAFWRGGLGFAVSATTVSAIWLTNHALNGPVEDSSYLFGYIFTTVVSGLFLTRYSEMQRQEHLNIIKTKIQAAREGTQLRSLINSMADAVIATDESGVIQLYNAAALLLLNTNQGLKDSHLSDLMTFHTKDGEKIDIFTQAQTEQRIIQRDDLIFTNNRDEEVNIYLDLAPIRSGHDNEIDGYIFLLRDISVQKSIEEQRDDFISIVSHELRTPIAIAEGNLSTALMNAVTDEDKRRNMIEQAHQNITYLAQLVNDITTLAHAERGDLDESRSELDLKEFIKNVGENYREQIEAAGLKLEYDIDDSLPTLQLHEQRLLEIMQDYLTNAIRYTDSGSIIIVGHELNADLVRIGVKDTGIGLSKSDQDHVFEKFYRSEDYRTRQHKGTGLGLYIAKKLSELIGVTVGVESELNKGSLFYVDIPHGQSD